MKPWRWGAAWAGAAAVSAAVALVRASARGDAKSARTVRYDLDATLDPETHLVHGEGLMTWISDAKVPVDSDVVWCGPEPMFGGAITSVTAPAPSAVPAVPTVNCCKMLVGCLVFGLTI